MLSGGGITSLTVGTSDSWSASTDASWLSLSQDGSTLYITAEANDVTAEIREADVTVSTSSYGSSTVQVRQEPAEAAELSVIYGSADHLIDSEGGTFTVTVKSDSDWTATLSEAIEGWTLISDSVNGILSVNAEPNAGSAITGIVTITAGEGELAASEQFEVTQISRAENPYYQFVGNWDVHAADCMIDNEWAGKEGIYTSCVFEEYDYSIDIMSMLDWGGLVGLRNDNLQYDALTRSVTMPLGYLAGAIRSGYYTYYVYLVEFNTDGTNFKASSNFVVTLSEDGSSATVSGLSDSYPLIGWVGYNPYVGYAKISGIPYCLIPLTMTKNEESTTSTYALKSQIILDQRSEIPAMIPDRLPDDLVGETYTTVTPQSVNF